MKVQEVYRKKGNRKEKEQSKENSPITSLSTFLENVSYKGCFSSLLCNFYVKYSFVSLLGVEMEHIKKKHYFSRTEM